MTNIRKTINMLVGKTTEGEYYFLESLFDHGTFSGATGLICVPVTKEEYRERTDPEGEYVRDYLRDLWEQAVGNGDTEESLSEWVREFVASEGTDWIIESCPSDAERKVLACYNEELDRDPDHDPDQEAEMVECIGAGRIFSRKGGIEWEALYAPNVLAAAMKYENKDH